MYPTIFGQAPCGVPSPFKPHAHPYPTRYHGPVWTSGRLGRTLMQHPAYMAGAVKPDPFSGSPDGLGQVLGILQPEGFPRAPLLDALLGAALGYFGAPAKGDRWIDAAAGGFACGIGGRLGLVALLAGLVIQAQRASGKRADLPWGKA